MHFSINSKAKNHLCFFFCGYRLLKVHLSNPFYTDPVNRANGRPWSSEFHHFRFCFRRCDVSSYFPFPFSPLGSGFAAFFLYVKNPGYCRDATFVVFVILCLLSFRRSVCSLFFPSRRAGGRSGRRQWLRRSGPAS